MPQAPASPTPPKPPAGVPPQPDTAADDQEGPPVGTGTPLSHGAKNPSSGQAGAKKG